MFGNLTAGLIVRFYRYNKYYAIHPSLTPAPLGYCCYTCEAFATCHLNTEFSTISVRDIPEEKIIYLWGKLLVNIRPKHTECLVRATVPVSFVGGAL